MYACKRMYMCAHVLYQTKLNFVYWDFQKLFLAEYFEKSNVVG